ncbi:disks large-associated protein 3-like [Alosa pseudoharengus]|uniref:disks large-associated protein 3-like n=1 Tax=Alosa pseudoharengus TaxID=34774 RepID=UPI003F8A5574
MAHIVLGADLARIVPGADLARIVLGADLARIVPGADLARIVLGADLARIVLGADPSASLQMIRSAIGSAQMLMSQKVQQFFCMCQQSVDPSAYPQPSSQDLSSFWDLLQLAVEDVRVKFQDLQRLKDSGWRLPPEKKEDKKGPPPLPKKPGPGLPVREKSLDLGDRQRQETRRRLLQTKRSASFRQNSATESADSIEIYIPEAQTRL